MKSLSQALLLVAMVAGTAPAFGQELGVSGELERVATTTPQEKVDYGNAALVEIDGAVRSISRLAEASRREGNVEQLQCHNTKLTAVRALRQVSESAQGAMQERLDAGDLERADHEFRKIAVALAKARQLLAEAERCGDTAALRDGVTTVIVEGGEVGSDADTRQPVYEPEFDVDFDPPDASPFF